MINLLPDDTKKEFRAARMNVVLIRYNVIIAATLAFLGVVCLLFYFILHANQSSAVLTSNDNSVKAASFASVRKESEDYKNNLTIANTILNNSVNYTNVVFEITKLLPKGVVLDGINLNAVDFGKQTSFSAHAKGYGEATQMKSNFQTSKIFSNVFFQSLSDDSTTNPHSDYPLAVTISANLKKVTP